MRKTSSQARLISNNGGPPISGEYGMMIGYGQSRDIHKKIDQSTGGFGSSKDWLSGEGSGALTTRANSFRGPSDPASSSYANEQQSRGYRAMRDASRGSVNGSANQAQSSRPKLKVDAVTESSKAYLRTDDQQSTKEIRAKPASRRSSKQGSTSSKTRSKIRSLSFKAVEQLAQAGAAPENQAGQDQKLINEIIILALANAGKQPPRSEEDLTQMVSHLSMLNILNAYDQLIKGTDGAAVDSLQATRIYRQLLKLHRQGQDTPGKPSATPVHPPQPGQSAPFRPPIAPSIAHDSIDYLPEKQMKDQPLPSDLLSASSSSQALNIELPKPTGDGKRKPEELLEEQFERLMEKDRKRKENKANVGGKPPKDKGQPTEPEVSQRHQKKPEESSRNVTKSKYQMTTSMSRDDVLKVDSDQKSGNFSARFSQKMLQPNPEAAAAPQKRGGALTSATQSFPDFHLKPDITHFAQDQFNLRVTLHDESSLFMNDSVEDCREPEAQMVKELGSQAQKQERRGQEPKANNFVNHLDTRVLKAKEAYLKQLGKAEQMNKNKPSIADGARSITHSSPKNGLKFDQKKLAQQQNFSSTQNLYTVKNKPTMGQRSQGKFKRADLDQSTEGKNTFSLSKGSENNTSKYLDAVKSNYQSHIGSLMNADLNFEGGPSLIETDEFPAMHATIPEPYNPPNPIQQTELPMMVTLGQGQSEEQLHDTSEIRATMHSALINIVQEESPFKQPPAPKQPSKPPLLEVPKTGSKPSNRLKNSKPLKSSGQSARLQFKRPRSSTGSAKDANESSHITSAGSAVIPSKIHRLNSARGAAPRPAPAPTEGILKKKDLQKQLSELDLEIERERLELRRMSHEAAKEAEGTNTARSTRDKRDQQQMLEVLNLQNEKLMELAESHWRFVVSGKVLSTLSSNRAMQKRQRQLEDTCLVYRKTRLLTSSFNSLKYFVQIIVREERTLVLAGQHYRAGVKSKVFKELMKNVSKKMISRVQLEQAKRQLCYSKKRRLFNHILSYSASKAIKKAQKRQAFEKRRCHLLRETFTSLRLHSLTKFNLNLMYQKAAIYHANNILRQSFTILLENSSRLRYERHLDELCANFQHQRQSLQDLKLSVFIALQKYTLKQKQEKKALLFYRSLLLRRSFVMFLKGVKIHRNYAAQKSVSSHLYSHKLMQITFTALLEHISEELVQVRQFAEILAAGRRRRAFRALKQSVARRRVTSWMKSPAGIRCARLMLKASFGDVMERVWDQQPGQKIERCREVQGGRVEMMLVNYLAVSKSHKYCSYFIEVNKILLRDVQKRAFRSLRINLLRVRQFQQRKHRRHLRLCFWALLKGVQGERLVDQYIGSMIKLRNMKLLKKVFKGMRTTTKELARLDNACCLILQQRKERIIKSSMRTWVLRYAEARKCRDLDARAEKFVRRQLVNKHMTIWIRKLAQKMKKKHLVANVMPLAKTRIGVRPYFARWLQAYKKNCYLDQQLESIDNFQNQELIQKYFGVLKQYTKYRQRKNHKTAIGRQQYVYYLGKRVFQSLLMNLKLQLNKQYLNTNIRLDYEQRLKQKVLTSLRSYAHYRIDRRLSDHVLTVEATKIHQAFLFRQWQNRCRRRQCLKYMESILDEARQRKAFQRVKEFSMRMEACEEVVMVNKDAFHLKRQYFCEFVRLVQKKNELIEKAMFLREHCKPLLTKRMFNQWKRRYQQRQDEYTMFFFLVLQFKRQTQKTYFKQLRQYALKSRLKKTSPLIHVDSLLRKSLRAFKLHVLTKQRHRTITKLINQGRSTRLKRGSLLIWTERTWQAEVLQLRLNQWRLNRKALLWNAWQATVLKSQYWKQRRQQAQEQWAQRQRSKAINQWKEWAITRQVDREKECIALQFHEQRIVQEVVRVWCRAVPENRGDRQRLRAVKETRDQRIVGQALQLWMQRAHKALNRVRGAKLLLSFGERRITMQAVMKMLSNVQEQREMERMADEMYEILKERRVVRAFQAMRGYVNLQKDQRDRLLHVDLYYDQKIKAKTLELFAFYVQSQKDKREMKEIAAAQRVSTLLRTSFLKLRTRWEQASALREATRMFEERQREKNGKLVMDKMRANMRRRREQTVLQGKAQIFRQFKTYEKVFRGIFTFCVQKASSSLQKEKARGHHEEAQLRQYFDVLRSYSIERKLLQQKRNMLFQVISTIDQQQLLQNSFDSLFRHLVNSTNDVSSAQYQLRVQKMQRIYQILLLHVTKKKAMRQLQQVVKGKNEQHRRAHFFLAWRKQSLQEQVVGERRRNQDMIVVEKAFGVLRRRWELKTKVDLCTLEKRVNVAQKCFGALVKNVGLKQDKVIKKQGASKNFQKHLKMKAWRSLAWQAHRGARLNKLRHAKRERTLKRGLSEWFRLASLRHEQRGILLHLVSKRDKENKLVAFKIMQRVAFMKKLCSIFESQKKMTRQEQREHELDVQVRAFTSLKTYSKETRRLRNIEQQIRSKNQRQTQMIVMKCLKHFSRSHLLCLKMHRAINPKLKSIFSSIKEYAEKEATLEAIENEVREEKRFRIKNRILYQWALLLDKRENIAKFIANRQYRRMYNCFLELQSHYIEKQRKLQKQQDIIEHFARKRPQCLHMFSKAFLLLNYEVAKTQAPQAPSFAGNSTLPPIQNILNSENSVFDDQQSVSNNQIPSSSGGSQTGMDHSPEGVPMCGTVLAKYTLEKWKLAMDGLRRRNQLEQLSQDQFAYMALSKTFREWRTRSSIKVKERRLLEHGREFRDEVLSKKSFEILVEYMHKRKNIRQLNTIGQELRSIRTTQQMHKMLVAWYDATAEEINTEKKFDGVVETFVQMQQEKYIPLTFNALKEYTQQRVEKRKIKEDLNSYAEQVYMKNVLRRALAAIKEQAQEESHQARVSKLFPIFQAWKFHVKENSLLKKYLSQAEQRSMKDESSVMSNFEDEDQQQFAEPPHNMLASSQAPIDPLQSTIVEGNPALKHDLLHSLYDQGMLQSLHEAQNHNGAGPINPLLLDSKLSITDIETSLAETGKDLDAVENALKLSFMKKDGTNK